MAKMFYTLEEASQKLGKSGDELKEMVAKGQLQEFRDRDRLMFKVEQVDLLAGGEDPIPLADSGLEIGLASSGTAMNLDSGASRASGGSAAGIAPARDKESTGISIFDADATDEADANAVTRMSTGPVSLADPGKSGSGSRLMDLTKESDDTSLGAGLLDDVYGSETVANQTGSEAAMPPVGDAGGLFETPGAVGDTELAGAGAGMMMVAAEPYDGPTSGWVGGAAFGMVVVSALGVFAVITGLAGASGTGIVSNLVKTLGDNPLFILGGAGLVVGLSALVGWLLLKNTK